ncbi:MAG TPA: adenosylmethionine--8-amino-7-oxononanoate transaminase [Chryseosolibacter sp.]
MKSLSELDKQTIWHPFTSLASEDQPILITSGEGVYLVSHDGRKIIDAVSSWWVNIHGHSNAHIANAIARQALQLEHVIFAGFTHQPAIDLSQNLLKILPKNQKRIFFSDNGSTAVEVGLKMAMQYWYNSGVRKRKVVAIQGAYHGDTFGSMSVGERGIFTDPFSNYLFETAFLDFPDGSNDEAVLNQFKAIAGNDDVAAFIYEPLVQGAAGMRIYSTLTLDRILEHAQSRNIICIADEVFTGFGRTGKYFASDYLNHKPDIICVSKGITGGVLPLGVTACTEKIEKAFQTADPSKTFFHGHSYTANPIACAAANASFGLLTSPECQEAIARISNDHMQFASRIKHHPRIAHASYLGTILSIELKTDEATSYLNSSRKKIYDYFINRNILLRPLGNVIYMLPPYVISSKQLEEVYDAIHDFINQ